MRHFSMSALVVSRNGPKVVHNHPPQSKLLVLIMQVFLHLEDDFYRSRESAYRLCVTCKLTPDGASTFIISHIAWPCIDFHNIKFIKFHVVLNALFNHHFIQNSKDAHDKPHPIHWPESDWSWGYIPLFLQYAERTFNISPPDFARDISLFVWGKSTVWTKKGYLGKIPSASQYSWWRRVPLIEYSIVGHKQPVEIFWAKSDALRNFTSLQDPRIPKRYSISTMNCHIWL